MNAFFDFTKPFPLSDVVLVAEDAYGIKRELHATKTYLAIYSSFFERMFFSDFIEANSNSLEVSCSYEVMKLILEAIYRNTRDYSKVKQTYEIDVLMELYKAADYLDFPYIRGICVEQMLEQPSVEMATGVLGLVASGLHLHGTLMEMLEKMDENVLRSFLDVDNSHLVFSKEDVVTIYKAIAKKVLPESKLYTCWACSTLPDFYEECENPLIDYTKKWQWSDVLIKTKNSEGKELYSCKAVLSMVSPHFAEMFSSQQDSKESNFLEIKLDVEYIVMKNILSIIHQCYKNDSFNSTDWGLTCMTYTMFCFASENILNIPKIRELCTHILKEMVIKREPNYVEFAVSTKMTDAKSAILEKIDAKHLHFWLHTNGVETKDVYVFEDNQYRVQFMDKKKPILSLKDVSIVIKKLLNEYNK